MFESYNGEKIELGHFVTIADEKGKIRKATDKDEYILGVTSATPGIIGDSGARRWKNKYLTDEWGKTLYEEEEYTRCENVLVKIKEPIINPNWNRDLEYKSRLDREEWVPVGLLGKILVKDDGTCKPMGYCKSDNKGKATSSDEGYLVLERKSKDKILILFR